MIRKNLVFFSSQTETVQRRVYKSLKLWSMYADLEESLGTFQVTMVTLKTKGRKFLFSLINLRSRWASSVFKPRWNGKKSSVEKSQKLKFVGKLSPSEARLVYEILEIVLSVLKSIKFSSIFYSDPRLLSFCCHL